MKLINASMIPYRKGNLDNKEFYKKVAKYLINSSVNQKADLITTILKNKKVSYPRTQLEEMRRELGPILAIGMLAIKLKEVDEE